MLLFCDTDCLIQVFIAKQTALLKWLKTKYGLDSIIVPEVESELSRHSKFRDRFDADLRKSVGAGVVSVLDYSRPELQLAKILPVARTATVTQAILATGRSYAMRLGLGEAYSHAACIHLGMPLLSHDINAIRTLEAHRLTTAVPVLRVFDVLALAHRKRAIGARACKGVLQELHRGNEWVPRAFKNTSFEQGLSQYDPRLHDLADYTSGIPPACQKYDDDFYLREA